MDRDGPPRLPGEWWNDPVLAKQKHLESEMWQAERELAPFDNDELVFIVCVDGLAVDILEMPVATQQVLSFNMKWCRLVTSTRIRNRDIFLYTPDGELPKVGVAHRVAMRVLNRIAPDVDADEVTAVIRGLRLIEGGKADVEGGKEKEP